MAEESIFDEFANTICKKCFVGGASLKLQYSKGYGDIDDVTNDNKPLMGNTYIFKLKYYDGVIAITKTLPITRYIDFFKTFANNVGKEDCKITNIYNEKAMNASYASIFYVKETNQLKFLFQYKHSGMKICDISVNYNSCKDAIEMFINEISHY